MKRKGALLKLLYNEELVLWLVFHSFAALINCWDISSWKLKEKFHISYLRAPIIIVFLKLSYQNLNVWYITVLNLNIG